MPLSGTQATRLGHYGGPRAARAAFAPKASSVVFVDAPIAIVGFFEPSGPSLTGRFEPKSATGRFEPLIETEKV